MRWARNARIAFSVGAIVVSARLLLCEDRYEKRFGKSKSELLSMEEFLSRFFLFLSFFFFVQHCSFFARLVPDFVLSDPKSVDRLKKAVQKKLLSVADLDSNRKIDFAEFLFLETLLNVPIKEIETAFRLMDTDGNCLFEQFCIKN
jgi:hypothetical protein